MNDYYEITFRICPASTDASDFLAALLADIGFESFVPDGPELKAYIPAPAYPDADVDAIIDNFPMDVDISYCKSFVQGKDWNEEWEKNYFKPIVIGGRLVIHSSFHKDVPKAEISISIDPRMAFGTGHHATTSMMSQTLLDNDINGKRVIDVGTGTGILAMLACKLGASEVFGIEIDPPAYQNALDNRAGNIEDPSMLSLILGDASALASLPPADILLANINRNIILRDIPLYAKACRQDALMAFSGFYVEDVPMIEQAAFPFGFKLKSMLERDNWACVLFRRE